MDLLPSRLTTKTATSGHHKSRTNGFFSELDNYWQLRIHALVALGSLVGQTSVSYYTAFWFLAVSKLDRAFSSAMLLQAGLLLVLLLRHPTKTLSVEILQNGCFDRRWSTFWILKPRSCSSNMAGSLEGQKSWVPSPKQLDGPGWMVLHTWSVHGIACSSWQALSVQSFGIPTSGLFV